MLAWARRGVLAGFSQARLPSMVRLQPLATGRIEPRGATVPPPTEASLDHHAVRWWQPILPGLAEEVAGFEDGTRPFQLFTRWYGFAYTYPGAAIWNSGEDG